MARSILVAEDSWLLAELMMEELQNIGMCVIGPTASLDHALRVASEARLSGALLDIELQGRPIFPVCEVLEARGIPFGFVTGRNRERLPDRWRSRMSLAKPFSVLDLRRVACGLVDAPAVTVDTCSLPMSKARAGR